MLYTLHCLHVVMSTRAQQTPQQICLDVHFPSVLSLLIMSFMGNTTESRVTYGRTYQQRYPSSTWKMEQVLVPSGKELEYSGAHRGKHTGFVVTDETRPNKDTTTHVVIPMDMVCIGLTIRTEPRKRRVSVHGRLCAPMSQGDENAFIFSSTVGIDTDTFRQCFEIKLDQGFRLGGRKCKSYVSTWEISSTDFYIIYEVDALPAHAWKARLVEELLRSVQLRWDCIFNEFRRWAAKPLQIRNREMLCTLQQECRFFSGKQMKQLLAIEQVYATLRRVKYGDFAMKGPQHGRDAEWVEQDVQEIQDVAYLVGLVLADNRVHRTPCRRKRPVEDQDEHCNKRTKVEVEDEEMEDV